MSGRGWYQDGGQFYSEVGALLADYGYMVAGDWDTAGAARAREAFLTVRCCECGLSGADVRLYADYLLSSKGDRIESPICCDLDCGLLDAD